MSVFRGSPAVETLSISRLRSLTGPVTQRRERTSILVVRIGNIARIAVMLASDRISGHVTGEVVTVAGGMEGRLLRDPS